MRLIDADALKEQFEELHLHPDLIELLDNAPTVYKRSQGKWVFHNESCRYGCNLCGNLNNILSNFCPNCGAKMERKCRKAVRKMTNEEAIKEIKRWIHGCTYADTKEAFELAIEALEENEKLSLLYSDMANEIARLKSMTGERPKGE